MQGLLGRQRLHVREFIADITQPLHPFSQHLGLAWPIQIPRQLPYIQIEGVVDPLSSLGFDGQIEVSSIASYEANTPLLHERQQNSRLSRPDSMPNQSGFAAYFQ